MESLEIFENANLSEEETKDVQGGRVFYTYIEGLGHWIVSNGETITTYVDGISWGSDNP